MKLPRSRRAARQPAPLVRAVAEELARFGGGSVNSYLQTAQGLLRDALRTRPRVLQPATAASRLN